MSDTEKKIYVPAEADAIGGTMLPRLYGEAKRLMWDMVQYKELRMTYTCAMKEISTKFEVLSTEFGIRHRRNPITAIQTRLKSTESILEKLTKLGHPISLPSVQANLHDVAGVRVICSYIDDIYGIADAFLAQDDITLVARKDYIMSPKDNGYRSLHLIVSVPVFFADHKKDVTVEVQIRTIAMDFWASLEHQMRYKRNTPEAQAIERRLAACADIIAATDREMLSLRKQIDEAEAVPTEADILRERLAHIEDPM